MKQANQSISLSSNGLLVYWIINGREQRYHSVLRLLSPHTVTWHEQTNEE